MKKLLKKMKNEKVAKGRIIGLAGPCFFFSLLFFLPFDSNDISLFFLLYKKFGEGGGFGANLYIPGLNQ